MTEKITRAELEASIKETEAMIATMVTNKYTHDGETTLDDVIDRICRVVNERTKNRDNSRADIFDRDAMRGLCENPHPNPKAPDSIRDVAITDSEFEAIEKCLKEGYFIPGGSILSGMDIALKDKDGKREKKSSLSNCYIIPIREDSIEGIFSMMSEMAKTFAHRGGVGVDITILRPEGYKVNNAAKTSTGAVSFMPLFSAVNSTIGQCLAHDTLVKTDRGIFPISLVSTYDRVWTKIGYVRVEGVIKNTKPVFRMSTVNGRVIRASRDHVFQIFSNGKIIEKALAGISVGDQIVCINGDESEAGGIGLPRAILGHAEGTGFPTNIDRRFAKILGCIYGDMKFIDLLENEYNESETVDYFSTLEVFKYFPKNDGTTAKDVLRFLHLNNLINTTKVPWDILKSDPSVQIAFIDGIVKANGKLLDDNHTSIVLHNCELATDVFRLMLSLGINGSCGGNVICIDNDDTDKLEGYLRLDTVAEIVYDSDNCETYDLKLEEEHLFWANGFYAHNSGRRGAALISIDCRHPDLMSFIWSKADPERVFPRDHMAQDITARELTSWLNSDVCINEVDSNVRDNIASKVNSGKIPDINGANISIKFTDDFFRAVEEDSDKPWMFYFPDINADKDYYNEYWDGVYEHWTGKLIAVASYNVYVTKNNYKKFIGKRLAEGNNPEATEEYLEKLVADGRQHRVGFLNPTAREILLECAEAGWMRGDPGVFFWDAHCRYSDYPYLSPELRPITTNPCGEISGYPYAACNLGAHVLYRYVENPYQKNVYFDYDKFAKNCIAMALFMNVVNDINTPLHPLGMQVQMEEWTKRIGVEFTGLADMLSMLNLDYGSEDACNITNHILTIKALAELYVSIVLAYHYGPVHYADPKFNLAGLEKLVNESPYIKHVIGTFDLRVLLYQVFGRETIPHNFDKLITIVGLRNVATNTVGPTGSLSILAGNCSSGVEPVFSLFMKRYTRVGDKPYYHVCHAPLARHLLKQMEDDPTITEYDIDEVKKKYHIVEAHELDYMQRIAMQSAVQKACDSSISSTVNLPSTATPEDIAEIYIAAHKAGLKGITIYRDGSMQGVLSVDNRKEKKKNTTGPKVKETEVVSSVETAIDESTNAPTRDGYTPLKKMPDTCKSIRHAVYWRGYKLYFIVVFDSETRRPMEIFTSNLPIEIAIVDGVFNFQLYQENLSTLTALTRMVSVALRGGIDPEVILKQLKKSAYSIGDIVSLIARVLACSIENDTENEKASGFTQCPVCRQNTLHRSGGCSHCTNPECMFSRCD